MDIEAEVIEIEQTLIDISRKIDDLLEESEIVGLMKLSEEAISDQMVLWQASIS